MGFSIEKSKVGGLCSSCKYSQTVRFGERVTVRCSSFEKFIPAPVSECSEFRDNSFLPIWDLEKMATLIDVKNKIGFGTTEVKTFEPGSEEHKKYVRERQYNGYD